MGKYQDGSKLSHKVNVMASQLFARVELRGTPGEDIYNRLHAYMAGKNWYQSINQAELPHATYQATFSLDAPNLMEIGNTLKADIERTIWTKALILVIRAGDWGKTAG